MATQGGDNGELTSSAGKSLESRGGYQQAEEVRQSLRLPLLGLGRARGSRVRQGPATPERPVHRGRQGALGQAPRDGHHRDPGLPRPAGRGRGPHAPGHRARRDQARAARSDPVRRRPGRRADVQQRRASSHEARSGRGIREGLIMSETTASSLPLEGIKVVEVAQALAGPFAGEILAHMGADVVKVERPEGDEARGWGPPFTLGGGPTFHAVNMNKRSIVLDLKDPEAIAWLKDYMAQADVLVQNLRPGVIEELGLGAEALQKINPRLIFCSLWAFGHTGPRRLRPGYEPMVQAFAGLFSINGGDEDPPSRFGAPVLDLGTGMWAAMGVLAALHQRASTGRGVVVDASLFETALGWLTGHIAGFRFTGDLPLRERTGSRRLVPFQGFRTRNGTVIIAAGNDRLFAKLVAALGHPEWSADPRFISNAERRANRDELIVEMEKVLTTRGKERSE